MTLGRIPAAVTGLIALLALLGPRQAGCARPGAGGSSARPPRKESTGKAVSSSLMDRLLPELSHEQQVVQHDEEDACHSYLLKHLAVRARSCGCSGEKGPRHTCQRALGACRR